jgi:predicted dehydrogenase
MPSLDRRQFLAAAAAAGSTTLLQAAPPKGGLINEKKLALACIGVRGRGEINAALMIGQDVRGLCDVDDNNLTAALVQFPRSKPYFDWREMIDKASLEAVVISTPDHQHAPIALTAMKKGLHVYIEKPLAHNIHEVRQIEALAKEKNLVAFMGNQHHVSAGYRRVIELLKAGTIGPVKEVHMWTNRPTWMQGSSVKLPLPEMPPPAHLNWDLWLGPAAERPYADKVFHPGAWRGWWDFGGGPLTDMGTHLIDPLFTGLSLNAPVTITPDTSGDGNEELGPTWSVVKFEFPARGELPALTLTWYDGGQKPPADIAGLKRLPMNGATCVGDRGKLFIPDLGRMPMVIPSVRGEELPMPEQAMALTRGHQQDWLDACRASKPQQEQFAEACRLTELCIAGSLAVRLKKPLKWDPGKGEFDDADANKLRQRTYRNGWELPG